MKKLLFVLTVLLLVIVGCGQVAQEAPAEDAPAEEAEAPVVEAPVEDAPAEEPQAPEEPAEVSVSTDDCVKKYFDTEIALIEAEIEADFHMTEAAAIAEELETIEDGEDPEIVAEIEAILEEEEAAYIESTDEVAENTALLDSVVEGCKAICDMEDVKTAIAEEGEPDLSGELDFTDPAIKAEAYRLICA